MTLAEVMLWGTRIGTVAFDTESGIGSFEYDRNFLQSGVEISPIVMPLSPRVYRFPGLSQESFHGLPGLLADSLPDKFGNAVIDAWLRRNGRSPESFNPVERLCYTGKRGMGALEYVPARGPKESESESIELDSLVQLASEILQERENLHIPAGEDAMREIISVGTSAGGARAKAVIAWNESTGDIRSGQIRAGDGYGYWLIKFDGVNNNGDKEGADEHQHTRIEYAYSLMAKDAGIQMSECRILKEGSRHHFMTRRFDRDMKTGEKIHMQTLGAIAHYDFNQPGVNSYEDAAMVMRKLSVAKPDFQQLYERMAFNVMACNNDDHVKNISFLMNKRGKWSLAPAYDITYAYKPGGMWTGSHQMRINGKQKDITREDLLAAAKSFGLRNAEAQGILEEVQSSLKRWGEFADQAELRSEEIQRIEKDFSLL